MDDFAHLTPYNLVKLVDSYKETKIGLGELLNFSSWSQATNPRDRIYALLGLVTDGSADEIMPDYTLSPCEVYCSAMQAVLKDTARREGSQGPGVFWDWIVENDAEVYKAAAGFMRTYAYLIQSEIDFRLANESHGQTPLLPFGTENTTASFERFMKFISQFKSLSDAQVSPRYSYGELRLRGLNWLTRFLCIKITFFHAHGEWGTIFLEMLAPLVGVFAIISMFLAAMQVGLAADAASGQASEGYAAACYWFSYVVLVSTAVVLSYRMYRLSPEEKEAMRSGVF
ncbi:hypothetical protein B0T16DRAFT_462343 [Cercophora newfieldiana]|uniref:Uncharacterized protein n=1 Tax=Cercophora newfieldiana TaxID=92897 RepID=A0AA39XRY5_9PEZI|nr:hypothetical protein B0T16DRAFT_462343 [Cercophora newfieldiana]